ncbi:sugar ABC transporter substrate-binding protein [Acuticoccus sediminis]|uniref:Sugar ABC transporter substrate-binding protein n=1 Tax=Acuticoccus sediminis TaxID=2184697 RepID=A0A8B2NS55_9HYPH|nr:SLBB domain-containing protein [Acuticoccus sediminis]RAI03057.1 sugar ABC transporter substrate-binding protein [Acuticoccus sediminis]
MRRFLVIAALTLLSACAAREGDPCVGAPPCPVYKTPEEAARAPACGSCQPAGVPAAPATPVAGQYPIPRGFQPWAEGFQDQLRFVVGDELKVTLPFYPDEEDQTTAVAPDGNIYVGLIGSVKAVNRTAGEVEADLKSRYSRYLRFPDVGVVPTSFSNRLVFVGGEVDKPGALPLRGPTGVLEAVFEAGGFKDTAYMKNVILIRRGPNNLPMMRFLDLKSFAQDGTPTENTLLRPFDIIFVPKSPIAKVNQFVEQYIEGVIPFNQSFNYLIFQQS